MSDEARRAQAELDRRRAEAERGGRRASRRDEKGKTDLAADYPERYAVLLAEATEEVYQIANVSRDDDEEGVFATLAAARAIQRLREEVNPEWAEREREYEERKRLELFERRMKAYRFPKFAVEALTSGKNERGKDLRTTAAETWLRGAWKVKAKIPVLIGIVGTGKTFAACRVSIADGRRVTYVRAREIYTLTDRMRDDRPFLERVHNSPILIVDEVGTAEEREKDSDRLSALFQARYDAGRVTIPIGNILRRDFERKYGDPVMSRVFQSGGLYAAEEVEREGEKVRQRSLF